MKAETFQLSTAQAKGNCLAYIAQLTDPDMLVTIKNKRETRSAAQHRLKWQWMSVLEKERAGQEGWNREQWNRHMKGLFMRALLIAQDEDYHQFFTQADRVIENAPDEESRRWAKQTFLDAMKTEWLTVKSMAEIMTSIDRHCQFKLNIVLPVPEDLGWVHERGAA